MFFISFMILVMVSYEHTDERFSFLFSFLKLVRLS